MITYSRRVDDRRLEPLVKSRVGSSLLGTIFDAICCALANAATTLLPETPRRADFATWVEAGARIQMGAEPLPHRLPLEPPGRDCKRARRVVHRAVHPRARRAGIRGDGVRVSGESRRARRSRGGATPRMAGDAPQADGDPAPAFAVARSQSSSWFTAVAPPRSQDGDAVGLDECGLGRPSRSCRTCGQSRRRSARRTA